jgi:hypothetical protein
MLGSLKKAIIFMLLTLMVLSTLLISGCANGSFLFGPPPYVPPEYYNCIQVEPKALVNVYFTGYGDFSKMEALYNDAYYIFKNVQVDERMFIGLNEGYIWVDQVKCYLVDPDDMGNYKPGDKIDVVGLNKGPTSYYIAGLTFKNCYVFPAGMLALPASPGGTFTPGY